MQHCCGMDSPDSGFNQGPISQQCLASISSYFHQSFIRWKAAPRWTQLPPKMWRRYGLYRLHTRVTMIMHSQFTWGGVPVRLILSYHAEAVCRFSRRANQELDQERCKLMQELQELREGSGQTSTLQGEVSERWAGLKARPVGWNFSLGISTGDPSHMSAKQPDGCF